LPTEPKESDLLVPFESENIPANYKEYCQTKRSSGSAFDSGNSPLVVFNRFGDGLDNAE
jgi:hypothetical protein